MRHYCGTGHLALHPTHTFAVYTTSVALLTKHNNAFIMNMSTINLCHSLGTCLKKAGRAPTPGFWRHGSRLC